MITQLEIGQKVIVQSNDKHCDVGTLVGWYKWREDSSCEYPLVRFDTDQVEYVCMGVLLPYFPELEQMLLRVHSPQRAWEIAQDVSLTIQDSKNRSLGRVRKSVTIR
jgi:hypothetical protein